MKINRVLFFIPVLALILISFPFFKKSLVSSFKNVASNLGLFDNNNPKKDLTTLTGIITVSPVDQEGKKFLNIKDGDYRINHINGGAITYKNSDYMAAILDSDNVKIKENVGKCVRIDGVISPLDYKFLSSNNTKYASHLILTQTVLVPLPYENCTEAYKTLDTTSKNKEVTLTGRLNRMISPSPDVYYDYKVVLDKPIMDYTTASGIPVKVDSYVVSPNGVDIWESMENMIDKKVVLIGSEEAGFAESEYILVNSIKESAQQ